MSKLLANNETINSEKYCSQLDELKTAIEQKRLEIANRKGVVFHQDNARHHIIFDNSTKVGACLGCSIPIPSYSPNLALSDFYLFRSNSLNGKSFNSLIEVKKSLKKVFFAEFFSSLKNLRDSGRMEF